MKVAELDSEIKCRVGFELRFSIGVPSKPGCYMLASFYGDVLYVGMTNNLQRRMEEHLDNSRMMQRTSFGLASWFYFRSLSEECLYQTERHLLSRYKFKEGQLPPLNRIGP